MIRVGVVARLLTDHTLRGWNRYTVNLLDELARLDGVEIVLYSNIPLHEDHRRRLVRSGVVERVAPAMMRLPLWEHRWLPRQCASDGVDVLHSPFNYGLPWSSPCPTVLTLHDAIEWVYYAPRLTVREKLTVGFCEEPVLAYWLARTRADQVVTVSRHAKRDIVERLGVPERRVHVVYEAADPHFVEPLAGDAVASLRAKFGLDRPYFLYLGGWEGRKNVPFLLDGFAAAGLDGVDLVLAGGRPEQRESFNRRAEGLGVSGRVKLLEWVDEAELPAAPTPAMLPRLRVPERVRRVRSFSRSARRSRPAARSWRPGRPASPRSSAKAARPSPWTTRQSCRASSGGPPSTRPSEPTLWRAGVPGRPTSPGGARRSRRSTFTVSRSTTGPAVPAVRPLATRVTVGAGRSVEPEMYDPERVVRLRYACEGGATWPVGSRSWGRTWDGGRRPGAGKPSRTDRPRTPSGPGTAGRRSATLRCSVAPGSAGRSRRGSSAGRPGCWTSARGPVGSPPRARRLPGSRRLVHLDGSYLPGWFPVQVLDVLEGDGLVRVVRLTFPEGCPYDLFMGLAYGRFPNPAALSLSVPPQAR